MRGEHCLSKNTCEPTLWIIPACAGNTVGTGHMSANSVDHPRMRGEHCVDMPNPTGILGTSPHTRGAL